MAARKLAGPNEFSLFAAMPRRERSRDSDIRKSPGQNDVPRQNKSPCRLDLRIPTSPDGLRTVRVGAFRFVVLLHVIKDSELHLPYSLFCWRDFFLNLFQQRVIVHFF